MDKKRYRSWDEILKAESLKTSGKRLSPLEIELLRIKKSIQKNEKNEMENSEGKGSSEEDREISITGGGNSSESERKIDEADKDIIAPENERMENMIESRAVSSEEKTLADFDGKTSGDTGDEGSSRDVGIGIERGHTSPSSRESILSILEEGKNAEIEKMKKKREKEQMASLLDEYIDWK